MFNCILILIILSGFGYLTWKSNIFGIVFLIVALPTYMIRFSIFNIPFTLLEILMYVLIILWYLQHKRIPGSGKFVLPGILLILASTLAIFIAPNIFTALGIWKAYFVAPFFVYLVATEVIEKKHIPHLTCASMILVTYISSIAILQYINILPALLPWAGEAQKRVTSVFMYPNAVGLLLTPMLIFLTTLLWNIKSIHYWILTFSICIMGYAALYTTYTKGAIIACLIGIFIFLLLRKRFIHASIGLCVLILIITALPQTQQQITSVVTLQDTSTDVRIALWRGTGHLLLANPLLGAGLSGFPTIYPEYKLDKHTEALQYPHNIFLNFWVETGILGLFALIWILYTSFTHMLSTKTKVMHTLTAILLGITIYGLVDAPYFKNDLALLFWLILACIDMET